MQSSTGRITPLLITKRFVLGTSSPGQQDTFNTAHFCPAFAFWKLSLDKM